MFRQLHLNNGIRANFIFYNNEGTISSNHLHQQVLDKLTVERERGITVKAQVWYIYLHQ